MITGTSLNCSNEEFLKKPESNVEVQSSHVDDSVPETIIVEEPIKEEVQLSEKEEFNSLNLTNDDLMEIKKIALSDILEQDISVSELVDLVLLSKANKSVKEKNKDGLLIREYIDREGKITRQGRLYLEFDETRERLKKLLK